MEVMVQQGMQQLERLQRDLSDTIEARQAVEKTTEVAMQRLQVSRKDVETAQRLQRTQTAEMNAEAARQLAQTAEVVTREAVQRAQTAERNAKAAVQRAQTAERNAEEAVRRAQTAKRNAEAAGQRAQTAGQRAQTVERNAEAAVQRAQTAEVDTWAAVQRAQTAEVDTRAAVQRAQTAERNAEAAVQRAQTAEVDTRAAVQRAQTAEMKAQAAAAQEGPTANEVAKLDKKRITQERICTIQEGITTMVGLTCQLRPFVSMQRVEELTTRVSELEGTVEVLERDRDVALGVAVAPDQAALFRRAELAERHLLAMLERLDIAESLFKQLWQESKHATEQLERLKARSGGSSAFATLAGEIKEHAAKRNMFVDPVDDPRYHIFFDAQEDAKNAKWKRENGGRELSDDEFNDTMQLEWLQMEENAKDQYEPEADYDDDVTSTVFIRVIRNLDAAMYQRHDMDSLRETGLEVSDIHDLISSARDPPSDTDMAQFQLLTYYILKVWREALNGVF
ncbi:hypothetical protein JKP88DRAFT_281339 [Tribonema minus]|uniref:Uncharacterized protein n=1 Tax=Tribonema minus TaxID=303371 RepID=A0A835YM70_9STRA|nr:hypothetical protein JKP88DRAFT_281339 [Tribonema minus]